MTTPFPGNYTNGFDNTTATDEAQLERIYSNIRGVNLKNCILIFGILHLLARINSVD